MNLYLGILLLCASQAAATLLRGAPEGVHVISQSDRHLVNQDWTQMIEDFKPMVVNVEATSEVALETESTGRWYATGFVVDSQRGIVATNAHVTGHSPSRVKINFFDGSFTEAKTLYYDPTHDFAFYKIDPQDVLFELQAVEIGKWRDLSLGDEVLLIGNNEREEYSIKYGHVSALNVNKGDRHSSYIHTTIDSAGGSSGSPVWNTAGQVIGLHSRGKATSSFELPAEYFADALGKLQRNDTIYRGEIGVDLELISIGESIKHFNLPEFSRNEIGPGRFRPFPDPTQTEWKKIAKEGNLKKKKVSFLKDALESEGLPISGKKDDLVARLEWRAAADDDTLKDQKVDRIREICTSEGIDLEVEVKGKGASKKKKKKRMKSKPELLSDLKEMREKEKAKQNGPRKRVGPSGKGKTRATDDDDDLTLPDDDAAIGALLNGDDDTDEDIDAFLGSDEENNGPKKKKKKMTKEEKEEKRIADVVAEWPGLLAMGLLDDETLDALQAIAESINLSTEGDEADILDRISKYVDTNGGGKKSGKRAGKSSTSTTKKKPTSKKRRGRRSPKKSKKGDNDTATTEESSSNEGVDPRSIKKARTTVNVTPKPIPRRGKYPSLNGADLTKAIGKYGTDTSTLKTKVEKYDQGAVSDPMYMPDTMKMLAIIAYHESE